MKDLTTIAYIIVDKRKKPVVSTIRISKRACIKDFLGGLNFTWKDYTKWGWKCIKVDITISSVNNN